MSGTDAIQKTKGSSDLGKRTTLRRSGAKKEAGGGGRSSYCEDCGEYHELEDEIGTESDEIHELEDEYEFGAHDEYEEVFSCNISSKNKEPRATQPTGYKGEFETWKGQWLTKPIKRGLKTLLGNDWAKNRKLTEYLDKMKTGTWDEVIKAFGAFEGMILNTGEAPQDVKKAISDGYTLASNNRRCRGKTKKELKYCKDKRHCDCAEDVVSHYERKVQGAADKDKPKQKKKLKTAKEDRDKKCGRNDFTSEPIPDYIMRALQPKKSVHPEYGKLRY